MTSPTYAVGDPVWIFDTHTQEEHDGTVIALNVSYNNYIQVELGDGPFKVVVHPSRLRHRVHAVNIDTGEN